MMTKQHLSDHDGRFVVLEGCCKWVQATTYDYDEHTRNRQVTPTGLCYEMVGRYGGNTIA
jgi:hypothetical protein